MITEVEFSGPRRLADVCVARLHVVTCAIGLVLGLTLWAHNALAAPTLRAIPTVLHAHSTWSTGNLALDELAVRARARGVEVVFLTENHLQAFEYGVAPLRGLLRYRVDYPSILSKGPNAFLQAVQAVNAHQKDVLLIPGAEVIPQYYWTGNVFSGTLTMHNAQKNLLVLGLYKPEDYDELPVVGNLAAASWSLWSLWLVSPVLLIVPGIWLLRTTRRRVIRLRNFRVTEERRRIVPGVLCLLASAALLVNNYPFRQPPVSAYDPDAGLRPHQKVIDFVAARGGLTVWSLPEARDHQVVRVMGLQATIHTDPYPRDLLRTDGFTAFGGVYEDTTTFTDPGGGWDQLLLDYLTGRRAFPAWAIGEGAFHFEGQAGKRFGDVQTVVLAEHKDSASLLGALRAGRAYARLRTRAEHLTLARFQVVSRHPEPAEAGSELRLQPGDRPEVHAVIETATGRSLPVEIRLIRSGSVIQTLRRDTPVAFRWAEPPLTVGATLCYRLEVRGPAGLWVLSNPIFVRTAGERSQ